MTAADRPQQPRTPGRFHFSLRGLILFTTAIAVVLAAGYYISNLVYIAFGFVVVLTLPGFAIELLSRRWRGSESRKPRGWSLSGLIAIIHLSLFLAGVCYHESLAGPDGTVFVDDAIRAKFDFVNHLMLIATFPIGWLGLLFFAKDPDTLDVCIFVGSVAANSALVGFVVAGFVKFVCHRTVARSPPDIPP